MDDRVSTAASSRLVDTVRLACPELPPLSDEDASDYDLLLLNPGRLRSRLERQLHDHAGSIRVTGTLDRRLVLIERSDGQWVASDLSGSPHGTRRWPDWTHNRLEVEDPDSWLSLARLDVTAVERLSRPDVLLAALYHPENFPLPRFPLGISDVARAARATLLGTVSLTDMQLGTELENLVKRVTTETPDILGVTRRHTAKPVARLTTEDIFPELDLLPATFERHGVAQVETSRGCTNTCSFCPRGHKGKWAGAGAAELPWLLAEMRQIFDRYPEVSRTLYLVDEEFIGRGGDAVARALKVANVLHAQGFKWESSCRIDQVVRADPDAAWHVERAQMWRDLVNRGPRRMLFGVESGVDSILARFNKETTGDQNALAIRTLSALGVPTRYTYITFDQLMTLEELNATYAFQGHPPPYPGLVWCPGKSKTSQSSPGGAKGSR
ncbi:hypothetical protein [Streptomyces finlayi]|uniref:hypothetical protein n=2 Tax=Streptomyces TaxID=1883 RepID=UPI001CA59197|nr:hypothetical protein [Streptomyces finlayi]